jgi:hypothetical protein
MCCFKLALITNYDRIPLGRGFIDQDQLERFSVKREYNQHIQVYNTILYIKVEVIKLLQLMFMYLLHRRVFEAKMCFKT